MAVGIIYVRGLLKFMRGHEMGRARDEDMTTLDTTKNIAYMYICEVISNANYAIIYLCYPGQKYFHKLLCHV